MEKQFICCFCGKKFANCHNLSRHRRKCISKSNEIVNNTKQPIRECSNDVIIYPFKDSEDSDEMEIFDPNAKADIATYSWQEDGSIKNNHCSLLPGNIRAIIVGKSGSGKTTFVTHLLLEPDVIEYNKLMVCGRSLRQPEYKAMRSGFDNRLSKNHLSESKEKLWKVVV